MCTSHLFCICIATLILICTSVVAFTTPSTSTSRKGYTINSDINRIIQVYGTVNEETIEEDTNNNFLTSLFKGITQNYINTYNDKQIIQQPIETEEEKKKRLRLERLEEIEAGEVRRQLRVSEDKYVYLFLLALQFLPLLGNERYLSILYFFGVAVSTVYLGGRQEVIDKPEQVSRDNALYAPVGASLAIGGLYLLLKNGIDITSFYAVVVTLFGALSISDIGVPILRNIFPNIDFSTAEIPVSDTVAEKLDLDKPALPLDGLITLGFGILCSIIYWLPIVMENKFIVSNFIAWAIGLTSLGAISLGSYQTGAILLAGLVSIIYDVLIYNTLCPITDTSILSTVLLRYLLGLRDRCYDDRRNKSRSSSKVYIHGSSI